MTSLNDLLCNLLLSGVELSIEDGKLRVRAPDGALAPDTLDTLRRNKEELLRLLPQLRVSAGQGRDQRSASLGLPPRIGDRAALFTDNAIIPLPRFRVDRFADRTQQSQAGQIMLERQLAAPLHERPDGGRRGVELRHPVALDDVPQPILGPVRRTRAGPLRLPRRVGRAFVHDRRRTVGERAVDDVAVAGDPAHVGGAPIDVAVVIIEHVLVRHRREDDVAAGRVQHALGLTRRARGIEDEERILGVHRLGGALGRHLGGDLVPPHVATGLPADLAAGVVEQMELDTLYLMGSGSTVAACMGELGLENTLLGVDLVENGQLIGQDLSAAEILTRIRGRRCRLIITLIGGQGHLFGRGNQQLSPEVIRAVGRDHIQVLATKSKLAALEGRPLLVDTDDPALNRSLSGYLRITTGYKDQVIYPVANPE